MSQASLLNEVLTLILDDMIARAEINIKRNIVPKQATRKKA